MNREPLFASLPVQHRTETSKYAKHMERLRNVKPSVDNGPPRKFIGADGRNGKREFQKQERRFEIEYENAILLDKMRRIMELGTTASNSGVFYVEEPDLTSLNSNVRRRDLERITRENMGIVRRIQASQSTYDLSKWEEQRKKEEAALRRLARKPRTIDNSNLLISSGISYVSKPYGTSPSRNKVPRQLPSLEPNLGSCSSQYLHELLAHVSPQSLAPLPHIAPVEASTGKESPAFHKEATVAPDEAWSPDGSIALAAHVDDAAHALAAEDAGVEAASAPADTAAESLPEPEEEEPAEAEPAEEGPAEEGPAEEGPAQEMIATVDPELVAAMEAQIQATGKAVSAIQSAVITEAPDLVAEIGPAVAAAAKAVAAIKTKAGCKDAEMHQVTEAETAAFTDAVAAIETGEVGEAEAAAVKAGADSTAAAEPDNWVEEVDVTAPQPDPELVAAMSAEVAATAEAVAAIQAAVGIEATAAESVEASEN